jgi:predicted short-subunit dehydrogenase-like oxidoreductase (DUF2520 family)
MPRRVGIIGRGRVGGALARALEAAGDEIVAHIGRADPLHVLEDTDLVIIAVPDEDLKAIAEAVVAFVPRETLLVHTSGAQDLRMFRRHGHRVGMLHPATPVADPTQSLTGVTFGVIGTDESRDDLGAIVASIGGRALWLEESWRLPYHAALVHASNHLVALVADAATLFRADVAILLPLLRQTLDNIEEHGPEQALTGPVVRGDAATVRAHLTALPVELRASYRENARRALALAIRSGRLDEDGAAAIEQALEAG